MPISILKESVPPLHPFDARLLSSHPWWKFGSERRLGLWLFLFATAVSIFISVLAPSFIPHPQVGGPNSDLAKHLFAFVDQGRFPWTSAREAGYLFYMAIKLQIARMLGVPYASVRYLDSFLWGLQGCLVFLLAQSLKASRLKAMVVALAYVLNPLGLGLSVTDNRSILSSVFLFSGLLFTIRGVSQEQFSSRRFVQAGGSFALGAMVRSDQILMPVVVSLAVTLAVLFRPNWYRMFPRRLIGSLLIILSFAALFLPWKMTFEAHGNRSTVLTRSPVWMHWEGMVRYREDSIGREAARLVDQDEVNHTWRQALDFHLTQIHRNPVAWFLFWVRRLAGTWYVSDTRRWDLMTLGTALPYLISGIFGFVLLLYHRRFQPLYWIPALFLLYVWFGSTFFSGVARYLVPTYWVLCFFAVEGFWLLAKRS